MQMRNPRSPYGNADRTNLFDLVSGIGVTTVAVVLRTAVTIALLPILIPVTGGAFVADSDCTLASTVVKGIWNIDD